VMLPPAGKPTNPYPEETQAATRTEAGARLTTYLLGWRIRRRAGTSPPVAGETVMMTTTRDLTEVTMTAGARGRLIGEGGGMTGNVIAWMMMMMIGTAIRVVTGVGGAEVEVGKRRDGSGIVETTTTKAAPGGGGDVETETEEMIETEETETAVSGNRSSVRSGNNPRVLSYTVSTRGK